MAPPDTGTKSSATLVWVVTYLALHAIWRQTVFHDYAFAVLRAFFLLALIVFLVWRGQPGEMRRYFLGPLVPRFDQRGVVAITLVLLIAGRLAVDWLLRSAPDPLTRQSVLNNCIFAPINEEIVFRGVFLSLLLQSMTQKLWGSIVLSALIFVGCHNLFSPLQIVPLLIQSLLYGYAFARTGSIPFCIVCHALWNAFSFVGFGWNP